jgi:hypothetical protein
LFVSQKMRGEHFFWRSIYKKRLLKFQNLWNKLLVKSMCCPQNQSIKKLEISKIRPHFKTLSWGPCWSLPAKPTGDLLTNDLILNPLTWNWSEIGSTLGESSVTKGVESIKSIKLSCPQNN